MNTIETPLEPAVQAPDLFSQALALHQEGQIVQARRLYSALLKQQPQHAEALHLMGVCAAQEGSFSAAIEWFDRALQLTPDHAAAYNNRGNAYLALQDLARALADYEAALALDPTYDEAYYNRGNVLVEQEDDEGALASFTCAIELNPYSVAAYHNRGLIWVRREQFDTALADFDHCLALQARHVDAHYNRGNVLAELELYEAALESFNHTVALKPQHINAHYNRGNMLFKLKNFDAARQSYAHVLQLNPAYIDAYMSRAATWIAQQKNYPLALADLTQVHELDPKHVQAHFSRGIVLMRQNQLAAAQAAFEHTLFLDPDCTTAHWNLGLVLLGLGQLQAGWNQYEYRRKGEFFGSYLVKRHFYQPYWLGNESLSNKTILLHCEQGLGDIIQFCRYVKLVQALGARVILEVPSSLFHLFKTLDGVDVLVCYGAPLPHFDVHCSIMSLPFAFNTSLDTVPAVPHYLKASPEKRAQWQERLGAKSQPRLGIVWCGNNQFFLDETRSVRLESFLSLIPAGFECVSLKREVYEEDQATLNAHPDILHFGTELEDFADTAALCELMDVIVTTDSSVAHLAGALGKPVWVLLQYGADWRWFLERTDSPWYPSAKLYRQPQAGDWADVFARVKADLIKNF